MNANHQEPFPGQSRRAYWLHLVALTLAFLASYRSVFLSIGLGLKACPLCFYQRSFAMSVFSVLLVAISADRTRPALHSLFAFPLAVPGLGIAAFHEYHHLADALECPEGILGLGTASAQSLAFFALLTTALAASAVSRPRDHRRPLITLGAGGLGFVLAWGSVASSPPLSTPPDAPYDPVKQSLEMCRIPYRSPMEAKSGDS